MDERVTGKNIKGKSEEYSRVEAELKAKEWINGAVAFVNEEMYESVPARTDKNLQSF